MLDDENRIPVKIIRSQKKSILIEYVIEGKYHRAIVPTGSIENESVSQDTLDQSIPYGLPWEEVEIQPIDTIELANELRRNGIWTDEDMIAKEINVRPILNREVSLIRNSLIRFAKEHKNKKKEN